MARFVAAFDIAVSLDDLLQGIASIDDRFYLARLNELFELNEIARALTLGRSPLHSGVCKR